MGSIPTARCSPRESPGPWRTPWLPSSYRLRDEETEAQRGFAMGHVCPAAERPRSWDRSPWGPKPCFGVALPGGAERRCWGPLELRPPWETPQLQQQQAHMLGPAPGPGRRAGAMQSQPSSAGPGGDRESPPQELRSGQGLPMPGGSTGTLSPNSSLWNSERMHFCCPSPKSVTLGHSRPGNYTPSPHTPHCGQDTGTPCLAQVKGHFLLPWVNARALLHLCPHQEPGPRLYWAAALLLCPGPPSQ